MATIAELLDDVDLLDGYALRNGITIPAASLNTLRGARANAAALQPQGPARNAFFVAYQDAVTAIGRTVPDIEQSMARQERLSVMLAGARAIMNFAESNGKKVDDDIRAKLLASADAIDRGSATVGDEHTFRKAYEGLTLGLAPVTADSIEASKTNLPHLLDFFHKGRFQEALRRITFGRVLHFVVFLVVLATACFAMSYYTLGAAGIKRYDELANAIDALNSGLPAKADSVKFRAIVLQKALENPKDVEAITAAQKSLTDATNLAEADKNQLKRRQEEYAAIPPRLWKWAQMPCNESGTSLFYWAICSEVDETKNIFVANAKGEAKSDAMLGAALTPNLPNEFAIMVAARTVAARLSDIFLPLLFGFLGSYAFILRNLAEQIGSSTLARNSAMLHLIRLGTGALAGFASAWLLRPDMLSSELKGVSSWAVAFIAGYGVELVFSFMNRIVAAFTNEKPT
jgi:hypothetical protein